MKSSDGIYPYFLVVITALNDTFNFPLADQFADTANDTTISIDANSPFSNVACMVEVPMFLKDFSCPRCETSPIGYSEICFDGKQSSRDGTCNITVDLFPGITRHFIEWPRYEDGTCPDFLVCPVCPNLPFIGFIKTPCPYRLWKNQPEQCQVFFY